MPISKRPSKAFFDLAQYKPFNIQAEIHKSRADIRVVCVGRQVGKSEAGAIEACFELFCVPGSVGWVIAPTYDQAEIIFGRVLERAERLAEHFPHVRIEAQRRRLRLRVIHYAHAPKTPGKFKGMTPVAVSEFRGKSADRIDNLRGATLDYAILDEAAMMTSNVWTEAVKPMLSTRKGWALIISTPKGYNWFYTYFKKGWAGKLNGDPSSTAPEATPPSERDPAFESFHAASWEVRKDVGQEWYDQARRQMPDIEFRQEFGAEFIATAGSVFQGLNLVTRLPYAEVDLPRIGPAMLVQDYDPAGDYVIGADFGKSQDFSVFTVVDLRDGKVACMVRTTETAWKKQLAILTALSARYGDAVIAADSWGVGDVLVEDLQEAGLAVVEAPFKSAAAKEEYINHLALLMERAAIALPDSEVVFNELRQFQYYTTPSGQKAMRAHGRGHDDIVVSLALAYHLYDAGGTLQFDAKALAEFEADEPYIDIHEGLEGVELDYELAEATRMFS